MYTGSMDIPAALLIAVGVLIVLVVAVLVVLVRLLQRDGTAESGDEALEARLRGMQESFDSRLHKSSEMTQKQLHRQFESSQKLIKDITRELTEVKATGREMLSFTEQLQSLEQTLKNPQRRGAVGEYVLEQVIANVLPPDSYAMQYSFKNGARADAAVFLRDKKMICIDAKFSLSNYEKLMNGEEENAEAIERRLKEDLKMRIQETTKYILPKEGTLDYAFMFIPSESLYYDLLTQKIGGGEGAQNMLEYAFSRYKVIIISPTTLLAYLQTVNLGLRSLKVEEHAQVIIKQVDSLRRHLENYSTAFRKMGNTLGTVVGHYNEAEKQYGMIDKDILKITGEGGEHQRELLDKPHSTERE